MTLLTNINLKHKYIHLFIVVFFLVIVSIIYPEYDTPDEYHHIVSTIDQDRHIDSSKIENNILGYNHYKLYSYISSYFNIDVNYKDPTLRVKSKIFDSTSLYYQTEKNTEIVVKLRVIQVIFTIFITLLIAYLALGKKKFDGFVSFYVVYLSWPLISQSMIGFNSAAFLYSLVPLIILLMQLRRFFLALLLTILAFYYDNQAIVFIFFWVIWYGQHIYMPVKEYLQSLSKRLNINRYFVLLLLVCFFYIYIVELISFISDTLSFLKATVTYLKRDFFTSIVLLSFSSLSFSGSLTSFNYYPVYILYFYLLYKSFSFNIKKNIFLHNKIEIRSILASLFIFVFFFGNLLSARYHVYAIPLMIVMIVNYMEYLKLEHHYLVYTGMIISLIGVYKFINESYILI